MSLIRLLGIVVSNFLFQISFKINKSYGVKSPKTEIKLKNRQNSMTNSCYGRNDIFCQKTPLKTYDEEKEKIN